MMSKLTFALLTAVMLVMPAAAGAQFDTDHPGYFPIEDLGILPDEKITLEVNLPGSMLKFVARAMDEEDPDFSRIVDNLKSIRVRGAEIDDLGMESVRSGLRNASEKLKAAGWLSMVRMREDDEEVYVFFKQQGEEMVGLTVFTVEDEEVMLINLVGNIDPSDLGQLADGLDLDLPDIRTSTSDEGDRD
jgi:hypothetical protein